MSDLGKILNEYARTLRESERITEPPKRWRNKFLAKMDLAPCDLCSGVARKGEIYFGCRAHPSKDVAEAYAIRGCIEALEEYGELGSEWLGAFPVDK